MSKRPLTEKQREVLQAIADLGEQGVAPSVRAVAERIGKSPTTVHQHLVTLEAKGFLQRNVWRVAQVGGEG